MSYPTLKNSTPPFEEPAPSTSLGAATTSSKPYKHVPATVVPVPPLGSYTGLRKTQKRIKKTDEVTTTDVSLSAAPVITGLRKTQKKIKKTDEVNTTDVSPAAAVGTTTDPCFSTGNEESFFEDFSRENRMDCE